MMRKRSGDSIRGCVSTIAILERTVWMLVVVPRCPWSACLCCSVGT